ncbi:MAG: peptidoglycan editing factor PgeF [Clostridiaceae bacterium]|nr:peptidoglycan editing factor PgeF [Clostridiaceae bacterium]
MKSLTFEDNKFLSMEIGNATFIFSTAENNLNFNKALPKGVENLKRLKVWFKLDGVGYCNQIHSDIVKIYKVNNEDGDGIITDLKNFAIGVFTADCVPILLYDTVNNVIGAVHSGWRSTVSGIVINAIEKMSLEYNTNPEDIVACIGPHNRDCCYEVGEEVLAQFRNCNTFEGLHYVTGRQINLKACIEKQLIMGGLLKVNIKDIGLCTYCSKDYKLHSYRKGSLDYGRMYSFIFIKD